LIREEERPMWKPEHRIAADRSGLRYPSDLTSAEWAIVEPMVPPAKHGGRKRTIDVREILNGIFYVLWTGCQWQALPKDLPPKSTVWAYFDLWTWDGMACVSAVTAPTAGSHPAPCQWRSAG
jgi:transposase